MAPNGIPDDYLPGSGFDSTRSPGGRKKIEKKKWNNTPTEESGKRVGEWLTPPSAGFELASPGGTKRRSYTIKREIPAPSLD